MRVYSIFLDFEKVYNCVDREGLWKRINNFYVNSMACVSACVKSDCL